MHTPPKSYLCRHLFTDGHRCGSPALHNEFFCYYHHATRRPTPKLGVPRYPDTHLEPFALPVLEDRAAIQLAISQVVARIASNDLDPKRARLLLFGLQIATRALPREDNRDHNGRYTAQPEDLAEPLAEIEQDPTYGPLAPIAEAPPPGKTPSRMCYTDTLLAELQNLHEAEQARQAQAAHEAEEAPPESTIPTIQAVAEQTTNPDAPSSAKPTMGILPQPNCPTHGAASPQHESASFAKANHRSHPTNPLLRSTNHKSQSPKPLYSRILRHPGHVQSV